MTCIVGIAEAGRVTIGGDSAGVAGLSLTVRADAKVFRRGEYVFGFTSSFRMGQLLRYSLEPPKPPDADRDLMRFMVVDFVNALRKSLSEGGYATKYYEVETGGTFLVGVRGRLFKVEEDYQVGEALAGYDACGCGEEFATGALYATRGRPARSRVRLALEAAEANSAGVRGPFVIVSRG